MSTTTQLCTFFVDGLFFGVDVMDVQEVIRYQQMTRVPLAPAEIRGLINLRGQIVTALDLRLRLGLSERSSDALPMNVVIRSHEEAVSLLVDEIGEVVEVAEDTFERPPETLESISRDLIRGVYKMNGRLLLALDIEKAIGIGGKPSEPSRVAPVEH
jgi:purine-binding chemotaxis protein CheW